MKQSGAIGWLTGVLFLVSFPSQGWTEQVPQSQASFAQLRENPDAYLGATVVLGGQIVRWRPAPQGSLLQVLQRPLGRGLRPERLAFSGGWFWVRYPEQLGPLSLLAPYITVIGEVVGTEQGSPLILAQEVFLFSFWRASDLYSYAGPGWARPRGYYR